MSSKDPTIQDEIPSGGVFLPFLGPLQNLSCLCFHKVFSVVVALETSFSERTYLLNFAQSLSVIYFFVFFFLVSLR